MEFTPSSPFSLPPSVAQGSVVWTKHTFYLFSHPQALGSFLLWTLGFHSGALQSSLVTNAKGTRPDGAWQCVGRSEEGTLSQA
jgi:hypothetical protein